MGHENNNPDDILKEIASLSLIGDFLPEHRLEDAMEAGEEPERIFNLIVENATRYPAVLAVGVYLPRESSENEQELLASHGAFSDIDPDLVLENADFQSDALSDLLKFQRAGKYFKFNIICLGTPVGCLLIQAESEQLPREILIYLSKLAHHASVTHERMRLSRTLQHFLDRVEVLNDINQLIASNVNLQKIIRQISRDSAFRFSADVTLTYMADHESPDLHLKGGYGCTADGIPKILETRSGIAAQLLALKGNISVPNLAKHKASGLEFLLGLGVKSLHACCLEVKGEALGILLVGFKQTKQISHQELTRFEEFCQGAAVAMANARSQERLASYTERLEELVEQRTADLAVQTDMAEKANTAKSQFLANMSHELRTPLTAIVGYASILVDGIFGELNEKQAEALQSIARSSDHLKRLINDVLNLARIESGKEEVAPENIPIKSLLEQLHKLMMQQAIEKGINLTPIKLDPAVEEEIIWADPKHIRQILINLISNGIKYTPFGGRVSVSVEQVADKIKIGISDTGVGIPEDKCETLFQRFERGDNEYSLKQEGTGIGLNLTKQLILLNGGNIGVDSEVGAGSTFWILIPRGSEQNDQVNVEPEAATQIHGRLDGLSILVIDDDLHTRTVLGHVLKTSGAKAQIAGSVQEGKEMLESNRFDLIVTDLAMPVESGLTLINHVRHSKTDVKNLPILVLSACAFEHDRKAAREAGASEFMAKPFQPSGLIEKLRDLAIASKASS